MTKQELRELDMLIAEKVMGWKRGEKFADGNGEWIVPGEESRAKWQRSTWRGTPLYSTHIGAAWQVVEKMLAMVGPHGTKYSGHVGGWEPMGWEAQFCAGCVCHPASVSAETAPLAICRAALAAVGALPADK